MHEIIKNICYSCTGDITQIHSDAIVNAANSSLLGGAGVDGAIHAAAGPTLLAACRQIRERTLPDGLPPGAVISTHGGRLHASHVIHTVGPIWEGGHADEELILASAYRACLSEAERLGCRSIAFPAISTGVYGFPKELAARIAWKIVYEYIARTDAPIKIYFIFFTKHDEKIFLQATRTTGD